MQAQQTGVVAVQPWAAAAMRNRFGSQAELAEALLLALLRPSLQTLMKRQRAQQLKLWEAASQRAQRRLRLLLAVPQCWRRPGP